MVSIPIVNVMNLHQTSALTLFCAQLAKSMDLLRRFGWISYAQHRNQVVYLGSPHLSFRQSYGAKGSLRLQCMVL